MGVAAIQIFYAIPQFGEFRNKTLALTVCLNIYYRRGGNFLIEGAHDIDKGDKIFVKFVTI